MNLARPILAPSCPAFPAAWTDDIMEAARAHTAEVYPQEAVGIVEGGAYVRLTNRSHDPRNEVGLDGDDAIRAADAEVFFHSHPDGFDCPSEADMLYQQQLGIPFVIQPWPTGPAFCFGDMLEPAPLLGRAFRHGVHDCYSLVRDWYRGKGIETLQDQARGWEWWMKKPPDDWYTANFPSAGFEPIPIGEATREGDVLLFAFRYPVLMHAALVLDAALVMHHLSGTSPTDYTRLSTRIPRNRIVRHAQLAVRYKTPLP